MVRSKGQHHGLKCPKAHRGPVGTVSNAGVTHPDSQPIVSRIHSPEKQPHVATQSVTHSIVAHTAKVFEKAKDQIQNTSRDSNYSNLISSLITEATEALGTSEVTVYTNSKDKDIVQSAISKISGAELSSEEIDCMGGIKITSKDGSMAFDNTIDARFERMKPLIRKNIAAKFNLGN